MNYLFGKQIIYLTWWPDSICVMGDKSTAQETMKNAGVPTVPGIDGLLQVLYLGNYLCMQPQTQYFYGQFTVPWLAFCLLQSTEEAIKLAHQIAFPVI